MIEEQTPGIEAVMAALAERGPCTGPALAAHLGCSSEAVRSRLGKLETAGRVRRTGRVFSGGRTGGRPPTEWEVVSANGGRAAEGTPGPTRPFPPRPLDERLQLMAEQVERANDRIEQLEGALAGAAARADQAEKRARDSEQRRFAAGRAATAATEKLAAAARPPAEFDGLLQAHDEAERLRAEAARDLELARGRIAELDARIEHLEGALAAAERAATAAKEKLAATATSAAEVDAGFIMRMQQTERLLAEASRDLEAARARIAELEAAPTGVDVQTEMRCRYFDLLLDMAGEIPAPAPERIFERLDWLAGSPTTQEQTA